MGKLRRDRLSELPRSLIFQILSFLEMRDVVPTSLLSKGWNNLWTTIPCLKFGDISESESYDPEMFRNFVNRALILWKGTKILKFHVEVSQCHISLARDLDLWMRFALEMKVEELNIHLWCEEEYVYNTLQCLNSCSSLRKLSLVGCSLQIHDSPAWNQLKSLEIEDSCFGDSWISEEMINQILLGTPQLDDFDLGLRESNENLNIMSTSLKRLKINKYLFDDDDHNNEYEPSLNTVLKICCPNLESLGISGSLYGKCLLSNVSSLTDATFRFHLESYDTPGEAGNELLGETLRQIFPSIQHIEKITLSVWCVEVCFLFNIYLCL